MSTLGVRAALFATAICLAAVSAASAAGDAQSGQRLAERWCAACHVVARSGSGSDTAPPFAEIAARKPFDEGMLRAWLTAPHPPMPNPSLSRREIDDVIAYLASLRPPSGP
jgi:mono/diheme cytochrome c family protein